MNLSWIFLFNYDKHIQRIQHSKLSPANFCILSFYIYCKSKPVHICQEEEAAGSIWALQITLIECFQNSITTLHVTDNFGTCYHQTIWSLFCCRLFRKKMLSFIKIHLLKLMLNFTFIFIFSLYNVIIKCELLFGKNPPSCLFFHLLVHLPLSSLLPFRIINSWDPPCSALFFQGSK